MKRFFLILGILLSTVSFANAKGGFGIKAGLNFQSLDDISFSNINYTLNRKTGWNAGILYKISLPLGFAVQPELMYSHSRGIGKDLSMGNIGLNQGEYTIDNLQLPVVVQWGVDLFMFRPYLQIAPYIGYTISSSCSIPGLDSDKNKFQYGVGIGAGLEIWKFQLSGRYCWDLGEVGKYSWTDANNNIMSATPKTKGFELSIAIIF